MLVSKHQHQHLGNDIIACFKTSGNNIWAMKSLLVSKHQHQQLGNDIIACFKTSGNTAFQAFDARQRPKRCTFHHAPNLNGLLFSIDLFCSQIVRFHKMEYIESI